MARPSPGQAARWFRRESWSVEFRPYRANKVVDVSFPGFFPGLSHFAPLGRSTPRRPCKPLPVMISLPPTTEGGMLSCHEKGRNERDWRLFRPVGDSIQCQKDTDSLGRPHLEELGGFRRRSVGKSELARSNFRSNPCQCPSADRKLYIRRGQY